MPEQTLPPTQFLQDLLSQQSGRGMPCNPCDNPNYSTGTQGKPCDFVPTEKVPLNPTLQPRLIIPKVQNYPSLIDLTRKIIGYPLYGNPKRLQKRLINICRNDKDNIIPDTFHPNIPPNFPTRQWQWRQPTTNPGGGCDCKLRATRPPNFKNGLDITQRQFLGTTGKKLDLKTHQQITNTNPFHQYAIRAPSRPLILIPRNNANWKDRPCSSTPNFFGQGVIH